MKDLLMYLFTGSYVTLSMSQIISKGFVNMNLFLIYNNIDRDVIFILT